MEIINLVVLAIGVSMTVGFAIMSWYNLQVERKRSISREKQLLGAIIAKDLRDYLDAIDDLEKTPKDKLRQTKAEHDLALEYNKAKDDVRGIPIT